MRPVGKTGIISCQISFYPLNTRDSLEPIREVVEIIKGYDIDSQVNDMSTIIKGKRDDVMGLLVEIQERMDQKGQPYTMVVTLSNVCGCGD